MLVNLFVLAAFSLLWCKHDSFVRLSQIDPIINNPFAAFATLVEAIGGCWFEDFMTFICPYRAQTNGVHKVLTSCIGTIHYSLAIKESKVVIPFVYRLART